MRDRDSKMPDEMPVIRTIAMPADANPVGDIFGGWLMWQMDLAASNVATRQARGRTATVAVDAMSFLRPVHIGGEVSLFARLLTVGRTSMRIEVEALRRSRHNEDSSKVTEAMFTFVAIDGERPPLPGPPRD